jgi:hypothetical protein
MFQSINLEKFYAFKSLEDNNYIYDFERSTNNRIRITQRSKNGAGHLARHYSYSSFNQEGESENIPLSDFNFKLIEARIGYFNDGEIFNIFSAKEKNGVISPSDIIHIKTDAEKSFTATGDKLYYHWPIFKKFQETGFGSIIRATMTNHQVCSSKCEYCSTIARNKSDSVTFSEAKSFFDKLYFDQAEFNKNNFPKYNDLYKSLTKSDIRLRGLILSGGGQPNLWPHFQEFINYVANYDVDLGLITNGFPKNITDSTYEKFKWVRISITPPNASAFYVDKMFEKQYIPNTLLNNKEITTGLSYVYGPWTTDDEIYRLNDFAVKSGFNYVRLLTDCNLTRQAQLASHFDLSERLQKLNLIDSHGNPNSLIFHQLKYHTTNEEANDIWDEGQCYLQTYNTFWDTTGHSDSGESYCYPCDSVTVLAENSSNLNQASERRFNHEKWGTFKNTNVEKLFTQPVNSFFDPKSNCSACLFANNNRKIKEFSTWNITEETTQNSIQHVNFP